MEYSQYIKEIDYHFECRLWEKACAEDKASRYAEYIREYPEGEFVQQADNAIKNIKETDKLWIDACKVDTIEGLEEYLEKRPLGRHDEEANRRIKELKVDAQKWVRADKEGTRVAYIRYQQESINGKFLSKAKQKIKQFDRDEKAWVNAKNIDNIESYQEYLQKFPDGEYVDKVRKRLSPLQSEKACWDGVKLSGDLTRYEEYSKQYPSGKYIKEAKQFIAEENKSWKKAVSEDTIKSYLNYINKYSKSPNSLSAKEKIDLINSDDAAWSAAKTGYSYKALMDYKKNFTNGRHLDEIESILSEEKRDWIGAEKSDTVKKYNDYISKYDDWPNSCSAKNRLKYLAADEAKTVRLKNDCVIDCNQKCCADRDIVSHGLTVYERSLLGEVIVADKRTDFFVFKYTYFASKVGVIFKSKKRFSNLEKIIFLKFDEIDRMYEVNEFTYMESSSSEFEGAIKFPTEKLYILSKYTDFRFLTN